MEEQAKEREQVQQVLQGKAADIIKAILWHYRHEQPGMSVEIRLRDTAAMQQCLGYNKQAANVVLRKLPNGHQIVVLADDRGNAITPVENNQEDFERGAAARKRQVMRDQVPILVAEVQRGVATGDFSTSDVAALCEAAMLLAGRA